MSLAMNLLLLFAAATGLEVLRTMGATAAAQALGPKPAPPTSISNATKAPSSSSPARQVVTGKLLFMTLDAPLRQWLLEDALGGLVILSRGYEPPERDTQGNLVSPGAVVQLDCLQDVTSGECAPDSASTLTVLRPASTPISQNPNSISSLNVNTMRLLVMILDYPCNLSAGLTDNDVRKLYLGPNQDGNGGLALKYAQCSYGKFILDVDAFRAVVVKHKSCSTSITALCAYWAMSALADIETREMIGNARFRGYSHYTYIVPPGLQSSCSNSPGSSWAGLAQLPGTRSWLKTSPYSIYRWATVMQESLHNFGLWHSWQNGTEYEDYSTAMGRGDACPNAAEISRMGWATPAAGGDQLNSDALPPRTVRSFNLPATYLTGDNVYLRVQPNWLPAYSEASLAKNLYLAVRVAKAGDAALSTTYASKVNIHEVNATMDNGYPKSYVTEDRKITFVGATGPLSQLALPSYTLIVYGGSWVGEDTLRVHLCRYEKTPTECPPISALETPVISPSPPSSPPPPCPPPPPSPSTSPQTIIYYTSWEVLNSSILSTVRSWACPCPVATIYSASSAARTGRSGVSINIKQTSSEASDVLISTPTFNLSSSQVYTACFWVRTSIAGGATVPMSLVAEAGYKKVFVSTITATSGWRQVCINSFSPTPVAGKNSTAGYYYNLELGLQTGVIHVDDFVLMSV